MAGMVGSAEEERGGGGGGEGYSGKKGGLGLEEKGYFGKGGEGGGGVVRLGKKGWWRVLLLLYIVERGREV